MKAQPKASHFIDGAYVEDTSGRVIEVVHPATGDIIARLHAATPELVIRAVLAAKAAQADWAALRPVERARILRRAHDLVRARNDEIARIESLDTGRALSETLYVDAVSVAEALEFYAGVIPAYNGEAIALGGAFAYTRREPLGVCVGIGAWNYPFQGAGWKSAPALAAGNAMVFKPSENSPLSALILAEIYKEAGLPDGLFNVVQGYGDVGQALVEHPATAKVSLTGSVPTGKKVLGLAGSLMKHGTMELGGKSPLIIFADAPLDNAVSGALMANFYSTGQVCTNGTRVFVERPIHDALVARVTERAAKIKIGDPLDPSVTMGPLISRAQQEKVLGYIEAGRQEGATLHFGGGVPVMQGMEGGFWIEPTIFTGVTDTMRIAREEIFGPVMSILAFDSEDEVIARANDTEFGLAAGVFTQDIARAHRVIGKLEAGMCWINNYNLAPVEVPFGGVKSSGVGRECALAALDHYTEIKSIYVETGDVVSVF
ncbi:betaine-aldehyde dehydrogenase [Angulomicrobium tetraedrale]|uniref:Betaine-aldehyde dehydrogenase n=1 Tax=Ancylobacter tetraedralis TaxID=217068 RepID=A0A839ZF71_9HYPH|nr:betaine-aldehyde dehydrogenase [Ancylobacter tetraedralis]